jgi:hypothetical protein
MRALPIEATAPAKQYTTLDILFEHELGELLGFVTERDDLDIEKIAVRANNGAHREVWSSLARLSVTEVNKSLDHGPAIYIVHGERLHITVGNTGDACQLALLVKLREEAE